LYPTIKKNLLRVLRAWFALTSERASRIVAMAASMAAIAEIARNTKGKPCPEEPKKSEK
jgi:hypothetical protein